MSEHGYANAARPGGQGNNPPNISQRDAKRILYACRDRATDRLAAVLADFVKTIEKAIYGLANQTNDQDTQSGYFVFMDQLRDNPDAIQERFKALFEAKINAAMGHTGGPAKPPSMLEDEEDELSLSLMDEGALESSVAITNMAKQLANVCEEQLFALDKRMALLLDREAIETEDNPFGPATVVDCLWNAQDGIEAPTAIKLDVFKIFQGNLERELPGVYQDLNELLVENRVLPKVRVGMKKRGRGEAGEDRTDSTITQSREDVTVTQTGFQTPLASMTPQETFAAIQQLLSLPAGAAVRKSAADPDIAPVMSALNAFQLGEPKGMQAAGLDALPQPSAETNILHDLKSSELAKSMRDAELLTLDVVARIFDAILEDDNIPPAAKAQIARLQIPVLKVAILDQAIFSQKDHPARRLLDKLAEAGMGWSEAQGYEDPLYKKIVEVVKRVMAEFEDEPEVFGILVDDLEEFLDEHNREAEDEANESAEVIAARERFAQASTVAQYQVERRLEQDGIPKGIHAFLKTHWSHLLVLICLEDGEGSDPWKSALDTMDQLLWSVAPKKTQEERQELVKALPGLIKALETGMESAGMLSGERKHVRKQLAAIHTAAIRPEQAKPRPIVEKRTTAEEEADQYAEMIRGAVTTANAAIHKAAQVQREYSSMGTTMVSALFHNQRVTIAHCGDSRAYRVRDGRIEQMTVDHTAIQRLIARGFYTPEEAKLHAKKKYLNHVTRALGVEAEVQADIQHFDVEPGDLYVLCSDGLSDMVDEEKIGAVVVEYVADLNAAAQMLIDLANQAGGKDNISVVIARPRGTFVADQTLTNLDKASRFEMVALTDVGRKRSHNEDCLEIDPKLGIGLLADGMGGYNAGEIASSLAIKRIMIELRKQLAPETVSEEEQAETAEAVEQEVIKEIEKVERSTERRQDLVALVQNLQVGSWVEFHLSNDTVKRGKLAWISPDTGTYLFTDAHGEKVVETTQRGLIAMFYRRIAHRLDDVPMFDRAVGNMMHRLESQSATG